MARRPKKRVARKVNLRKAYEMGGYTGDYAWFVRTKALPIIGEASLHSINSLRGSRVKEYSVTERNFHRVVKALGIDNAEYKQGRAMQKAISKNPVAAAELILKLVKDTTQPAPTEEFPIRYRIPIHPISHNMLYKASGSHMYRTTMYNKWRTQFFKIINSIADKDTKGVDFTKPLEVIYYFGHREKSARGHSFDRPNFQKSAQDCIFEYFGHEDSKALDTSVKGEFVNEYTDGFIEFSIRNT